MENILNLTQHHATPEQEAVGVVEPRMAKEKIQKLLTFENVPTSEEIDDRARELAEIASEEASMWQGDSENEIFITHVMIGGAPYLMSALERALPEEGYHAVYAFSKRESVEVQTSNGVEKKSLFKHVGFVEV